MIDAMETVIKATSDDQQSRLMTVRETANLFRLKESTIRDWVLRRKITYVKLGGRVFIRKVDAEALIESSMVPAIHPAVPADSATHELEGGCTQEEVKIRASQ